jgi:hypothetical protein
MAHFAKLNNDNIVIDVQSVHNDTATDEAAGITFLNNLYGTSDTWKQTSYNTKGNVHKLGGTPLRKNYAGIGFTYDEDKDAFIPPKDYPSWTLNETTCLWDAPVAMPDDGKYYIWNEDTTSWDLQE